MGVNRFRRCVSAVGSVVGLGLAALFAASVGARADVTLPALFTQDMVLQRNEHVPIWGKAAPGEKVRVRIEGREAEATAGSDGNWRAVLPPLTAGGPYELRVTGEKNTVTVPGVLVGEVWLCSGQSNMEFRLVQAANAAEAIPASTDPLLHLFHVARMRSPSAKQTDVKANWVACGPDAVKNFSAVGYFFARDLRKFLGNVPVGMIESDWGGTPAESWTDTQALEANDYLRKTYVDGYAARYRNYIKALAAYPAAVDAAKAAGRNLPGHPNLWKPGELYNGMIAPLEPYALRGFLWYQGESNTGNPAGYRPLLDTMIADWRKSFDRPSAPFLIVQLAPYGNGKGNSDKTSYAELRESQELLAKDTPDVGVAVITDVGDEGNIHPTRKEPAGARLALLAERIAYHQNVDAVGPTFRSLRTEGDKAIVTFDHVGAGLQVHGGDASGQTVSGDTLVGFSLTPDGGKTWVPATAKIIGPAAVEVSAPGVAHPDVVRFGFVNFPVVNLFNSDGLPAFPFRSDMPK